MRKEFACARSRLVDRTDLTFKEYASVLVALQDAAFFHRFNRTVAQKIRQSQSQMARQMFRIPLRDLSCRHPAAVPALPAIDPIFHILCDRLEAPLHKMVPLHPAPETLVFLALLFAETLDLHEVRYHLTSISTNSGHPNILSKNCSYQNVASRDSRDNESVTDQLYLSIWLDRHNRASRLQQFEKLLRLFPFSPREQPQSILSIHAIDSTEAPLLERPLNGPIDVADVLPAMRDYQGDDIAYEIESWWDLWQFDEDWELRPAPVALACFGPNFDNGTEHESAKQEDLRVDFGVDSHYLPRLDVPGGARLIESNIKSLLRLVHEVDLTLPVATRKLETESGENFADRLQQMLASEVRIN